MKETDTEREERETRQDHIFSKDTIRGEEEKTRRERHGERERCSSGFVSQVRAATQDGWTSGHQHTSRRGSSRPGTRATRDLPTQTVPGVSSAATLPHSHRAGRDEKLESSVERERRKEGKREQERITREEREDREKKKKKEIMNNPERERDRARKYIQESVLVLFCERPT